MSYTLSSRTSCLLRNGGAQPLSPRIKALIDIQRYEGSFELDSALAALLGISSIPDLEAKLATCYVFSGEEQKREVWATVFTIKVFETQLAGKGVFGGWWWRRLGRG